MAKHAKMLRRIAKAKVENGDIVTLSFVEQNKLIEGKQWEPITVPDAPAPAPTAKTQQKKLKVTANVNTGSEQNNS